MKNMKFLLIFLSTLLLPIFAFADATPTMDKGDTAWMLISSVLVLLMLIPGLALFYGGLVKKQSVLAVLMQSFGTAVAVSLLWIILGYSLAFTEGSPFIGGFSRVFLSGMDMMTLSGTIPESVFVMFQLTFGIITPAIMIGSIADRIKFSSCLLLVCAWSIFVYCPIAHWLWGPKGFLGGTGIDNFKGLFGLGPVMDFAGGMVVHISSGVSALVLALVLGPKKNMGDGTDKRYSLAYSLVGASLLWVGWFGFNAGSANASGERAGMAMLVTHIAASAAAFSWMVAEWMKNGKPTVTAAISGAVAGLVAITPASGFVGVIDSFIIGLVVGPLCCWSTSTLKSKMKYDDALDAFGVHAVGGIWGSIATGIFARNKIGAVSGLLEGNATLLVAQIVAVAIVIVFAAVVTFILVKVLTAMFGDMKVSDAIEAQGLDKALHNEELNN